MHLIKELITIDPSMPMPVYLQIANAFAQHIRHGHFRKGSKLPGSRELGKLLSVNRMTAVAAYDELESQGWIEKIPSKGTFVKVMLPVLSPASIMEHPSGYTYPPKPFFPVDETGIIPVRSSDFPTPRTLYFNDGFPVEPGHQVGN